jgi:hypothetical protein
MTGVSSSRAGWRGLAAALVSFGVAFGFVEAAVVVDLRTIYEPLRHAVHPQASPAELFPALTLEQLQSSSPRGLSLLKIELLRELATIVMLASVGAATGGSACRRFAAFLAVFGVWDLSFYLFLKVLIDWPATVWTWDLLFLLPVPWSGPVLAPMIVAVTMIVCGLHTIARDAGGRPVVPTCRDWSVVFAGGLLIFGAFVGNQRIVTAGGVPAGFDWRLFAVGEVLAVGGYVVAAMRQPGRVAAD